ncbi:MAG: hypothetical protein GC191_12415 [Azospirillum sp.]|nr:hypothetical protein [Azospirillum sp.]
MTWPLFELPAFEPQDAPSDDAIAIVAASGEYMFRPPSLCATPVQTADDCTGAFETNAEIDHRHPDRIFGQGLSTTILCIQINSTTVVMP